MTQPIDYLLAALSQTSNADSAASISDTTNNRDRQPQSNLTVSNNQHNDDAGSSTQMSSQRTLSPSTIRRNLRMVKFLSSSSLKKRQIKTSNCKYCVRFCHSRRQVQSHLEESEMCQALSFRLYHVTQIDAVLIKIFRCIACGEQGTFQLKGSPIKDKSYFQTDGRTEIGLT